MNFMEAVKAMKEGKKVRIKDWDQEFIYLHESGKVLDETGEFLDFDIIEFESTDWEVVKKDVVCKPHNTLSLSDKFRDYEHIILDLEVTWQTVIIPIILTIRLVKILIKPDQRQLYQISLMQ